MANPEVMLDPLEHDEAVLMVLRETLVVLRAALDGLLGSDEADEYGLTAR